MQLRSGQGRQIIRFGFQPAVVKYIFFIKLCVGIYNINNVLMFSIGPYFVFIKVFITRFTIICNIFKKFVPILVINFSQYQLYTESCLFFEFLFKSFLIFFIIEKIKINNNFRKIRDVYNVRPIISICLNFLSGLQLKPFQLCSIKIFLLQYFFYEHKQNKRTLKQK